jgi:hypothetical protein
LRFSGSDEDANSANLLIALMVLAAGIEQALCQQTSEAMNAMLRMSASFRAAPVWRQRQNEPSAARLQTQNAAGPRAKLFEDIRTKIRGPLGAC